MKQNITKRRNSAHQQNTWTISTAKNNKKIKLIRSRIAKHGKSTIRKTEKPKE